MKKSWKMFLPLVICLALCMSLFTVSASAASKSTPGEVVKDDQGNWVAVDKNGDPVKSGWVGETSQDEKGKTTKSWYYVSNGELLTGWHNVDGNWYYFNNNGNEPFMWDNSAKYGPLYIPVEGDAESTKAFNNAKNIWWFNADGTVGGESGWKSYVTTKLDTKTGEEVPYRAWFYVNSDGTVAKGWKDDAGNWYELGVDNLTNRYEFNPNITGEAQIGNADGFNQVVYPNVFFDNLSREDLKKMPSYWVNPDGTIVMNDWASFKDFEDFDPNKDPHRYWVFADEKGELVQGWNNIDGTWYYFGRVNPNDEKPQGYIMSENTYLEMDGNVYRVDKLGAMVTGWAEDLNNEGEWNYFDPATGAAVQDQWKQIDGKWYYFDGGNAVNDGFFNYDGDNYYLGKDGVMATGWVQDQTGGDWYKFGDDGVEQYGWVEDGGNWYYLNEDTGALVVNDWVDGEYVGSDGAWVPETPVDVD